MKLISIVSLLAVVISLTLALPSSPEAQTEAAPTAAKKSVALSLEKINDRWGSLDKHLKAYYASTLSEEASKALLLTLTPENQKDLADIVAEVSKLPEAEQKEYIAAGYAMQLERKR